MPPPAPSGWLNSVTSTKYKSVKLSGNKEDWEDVKIMQAGLLTQRCKVAARIANRTYTITHASALSRALRNGIR